MKNLIAVLKYIILCLFLVTGCTNPNDQTEEIPCTSPIRALPGAGDVRQAPTRVIIFDGQSNMIGEGDTQQLPVSELGPINNVLVWINDHWETYLVNQTQFGPEHRIAVNWYQNNPTDTIGIIKTAMGGRSMRYWDVSGHGTEGCRYRITVDAWRASGSLPVLTIYWMQGESDTQTQELASMYQSRFQAFISTIRTEMGSPPFIFGISVTTFPYIGWIQSAQIQVAQNWGPDVRMVETRDLTRVSDGVHLDTQGQIIFGDRLYDEAFRPIARIN